MKKLFEEFKEYENLWEDAPTEEPKATEPEEPEEEEDEQEVEEQKLRDELNLSTEEEVIAWYKQHNYRVEISYPGYTDTWDEDRWDPNSDYGHYTVTKSKSYDDFEYEIDVEEALEFVWDKIIWNEEKYLTPTYLDKVVKKLQRQSLRWEKDRAPQIAADAKEFLSDYQRVRDFCDKWDDDELLTCFVASRLDSFEYYYEEIFRSHYYDEAHGW